MILEQIKIGTTLPEKHNRNKYLQAVEFWRNSYEVGPYYLDGKDEKAEEILVRFQCEDCEDYKRRKQIFKPRNYCAHILKKYQGFLFRNSPERTNEALTEFYNNVDLYGTSIDMFMKKALGKAQVDGHFYLMPDTTQPSGDTVLTLAQAKAMESRFFIRGIPCEAVVNYYEQEGYILEALVLFKDETGKPFARWVDSSDFVDIMLEDRGKGNLIVSSFTEKMPHGFSSIPFVEVDTDDFGGGSQIATIAQAQRSINNLLSLLALEVAESTFTRHAVFGVELPTDENGNPQPPATLFGNKRITYFTEATAKMEKIGNADVSQADSIRISINDEIENLYRTAGLAAPNPLKTNAPQSGIALSMQFNDVASVLNHLSYELEEAENQIIQLIADAMGISYQPVYYSREYDLEDVTEATLKLRDMLALPLPEDAKQKLIENFTTKFI